MNPFHPTAEEVGEAVLRLRHEGSVGGTEFSYLPDRTVEVPALKYRDLVTLAWCYIRSMDGRPEVPALASVDDEPPVPLDHTGETAPIQ